MDFQALLEQAKQVNHPRQLAPNAWAGSVAAAILSQSGRVYTGVCIDVPCGMGFCAEHAAIAAMVTAGESRILKMVAVKGQEIVPPCGRCREFANQIHEENLQAEVMVNQTTVVPLKDLLPFVWESGD